MTTTPLTSRFLQVCYCPSHNVLLPITRGVEGKHQWCRVLNTLQYAAKGEGFFCQEKVVLPKADKPYWVSRLTFPKST